MVDFTEAPSDSAPALHRHKRKNCPLVDIHVYFRILCSSELTKIRNSMMPPES